jgi:hemerythrin-like domain-containing protein
MKAETPDPNHRRRMILMTGLTAPIFMTTAHSAAAAATRPSANEDLMQEHGLATRVMLIYGRAIALLNQNQRIDPALIGDAAQIVARVIHGHHEQEEEQILFPVVEKQRELSNLVQTLRGQHNAARGLTASIGNNLSRARLANVASRRELATAMLNFINMYQPHGAYEDTLIYPAYRRALTPAEYEKISERFANNERQMNGDDGLSNVTRHLAAIEKELGIDLAHYTRQMNPPESTGGTR